MGIPTLTRDGVLPQGVHHATLRELARVFGGGTARRAELMLAVQAVVVRARRAGIRRIAIDGSFVTAKKEPKDVDIVLRSSAVFDTRLAQRNPDALWLKARSIEPRPRTLDLYVARSEQGWRSWIRFFEGEALTGGKGIVEIDP